MFIVYIAPYVVMNFIVALNPDEFTFSEWTQYAFEAYMTATNLTLYSMIFFASLDFYIGVGEFPVNFMLPNLMAFSMTTVLLFLLTLLNLNGNNTNTNKWTRKKRKKAN